MLDFWGVMMVLLMFLLQPIFTTIASIQMVVVEPPNSAGQMRMLFSGEIYPPVVLHSWLEKSPPFPKGNESTNWYLRQPAH